MKSQVFDAFGESVKGDNIIYHFMSTTDTDIDRQFRRAENKLWNEGVGNKYGKCFYDPDDPNAYKIDVILYASDDDCISRLMAYAERTFHKMNDDYTVKSLVSKRNLLSSIIQLHLMEILFLSITSGCQRLLLSQEKLMVRITQITYL